MDYRTHPFYQQKEVKNALNQAFDNGHWWKYTSDNVHSFEQQFARHHDASFGVSVCNGTLAMEVIFKAIGLEAGDEVILPAYDFYSLPKSVINFGAIPVFVDVVDGNFTIDSNKIEDKISDKTKAIVAVHISSSVAELDKIQQVARKHNVLLIEDCAQAHAAIYDGKKVGSWGDIGLFSFGGVKLMTCGQGGAIITSNESLYNKMYAITNRGLLSNGKINPFGIIGENYQLSELQAALLIPQLESLEKHCQQRDEAIQYLDDQLRPIAKIHHLMQFEKTHRRAQMRYSLYLEEDKNDQISTVLLAEGFPITPIYSSIINDERLQGNFSKSSVFNNAQKAENRLVSLHHTFLLSEKKELDRFIENLAKIAQS